MSKHFKTYTVPFADPSDFQSDEPVADATKVCGGGWSDACEQSPSHRHEFNVLADRCIHCGEKRG